MTMSASQFYIDSRGQRVEIPPDYDCRSDRIAKGIDVIEEQRDGWLLVRCVSGMHEGDWLLWRDGARMPRAIGSEEYVRRCLAAFADPLPLTSTGEQK
jgi:hypothetical protein